MNGSLNLTRAQARTELSRRGYSPELVSTALDGADLLKLAGDGTFLLPRHQVRAGEDGTYTIIPVPWSDNPGAQVMDGHDPAVPARAIAEDVSGILETIEAVDAWLDGAVAAEYGEQPLSQDWARTAKVGEETGEAQEELKAWRRAALDQARVSEIDIPAGRAISALIAVTGQNPRKGVHGTREALLKELADVVCTGLFAIQHFTKDTNMTWMILLETLDKARSRVPSGSPFPPESGMSRQDAIDNGIIR